MDAVDDFLSIPAEEENTLLLVSKCRLQAHIEMGSRGEYANLDFVNLDNNPSTSPECGNPVFLYIMG